MAQKLSVQIELQGAAEIQRQLQGLGETGQKAFADIKQAAEQVGGFQNLDPTVVTEKLQEMGVTGVDAIEKIQDAVQQATALESTVQQVEQLERAFSSFGRSLGPIGAEIRKVQQFANGLINVLGPGGAALTGGFIALAASLALASKAAIGFAESVSAVNAEAAKVGLNIEQYDKLRLGLEALGLSAKDVSSAIANFAKTGLDVRGLPQLIQQLQGISNPATQAATAIQLFGEEAGPKIAAQLQAGANAFAAFNGQQQGFTQQWANSAAQVEAAVNRMTSAWARFGSLTIAPAVIAGLDLITSGINLLSSALQNIPWSAMVGAAQGALSGIAPFFQPIILGIQTVSQAIQTIPWSEIGPAAVAAWNQVVSAVQGAASAVNGFIQSVTGIDLAAAAVAGWNLLTLAINAATAAVGGFIAALLRAIGVQSQLRPPGQAALSGVPYGGENAAGGLIGGYGTGTSDSNLSWVSRGEYITPAAAVAQPGVLAFLEALRRSGGNLADVLNGMGRFALGGLVPRPMPAFARGGSVGSMSNVTIQFPGLPAISGLSATSAVVDELRRAAVMAQVRSGGRKPSRYS